MVINTTPDQTQARVVTKRAVAKGRKAIEKNFSRLEKLSVVYLPIDQLIPNDWNPNRQSDHDFELLLRSMEEDGFTQPVLALAEPVNGAFYVIVDGEHRWRAASVLGYSEIPVVLMDMTPEQARISTIRHNRARGTHDIALEAEILRDLQRLGALDVAVDSLIIDEVELNRMLNDITAPDNFANEVFSMAWIPDTFTPEEKAIIEEGNKLALQFQETGTSLISLTPQAIEVERKRELLLERAKTEEDKAQAMKESLVYRISLAFSGDEAKIVKAVLGHTPAARLLEICQRLYDGDINVD